MCRRAESQLDVRSFTWGKTLWQFVARVLRRQKKEARYMLCILKSQYGIVSVQRKRILSLLTNIYFFVLLSFTHHCQRSAKAHRRGQQDEVVTDVSSSATSKCRQRRASQASYISYTALRTYSGKSCYSKNRRTAVRANS